MHVVWDLDVVRSLGRNTGLVAATLETDIKPAHRRAWQSGSAATWANESFQIADREIYAMPSAPDVSGPMILPRDYPMREGAIARTQLEKAGVRLAWVLNNALR